MKNLSDVHLDRDDFEVLAQMCAADDRFPDDYASWCALIEEGDKEARHAGHFPPPLVLKPEDFAAWCRRAEVVPCVDALRAYVTFRQRLASTSEAASDDRVPS